MTGATLPTTLMNEAIKVAGEALGTRLASKGDFDLMAVSRGAMTEAHDTGFTDEHRLHRFALHLLVEAELNRCLIEHQNARKAQQETRTLQKPTAHKCTTQAKDNILPWPKKVRRTGSL